MNNENDAIAHLTNNELRGIKPSIDRTGANGGKDSQHTTKSRADARKRGNRGKKGQKQGNQTKKALKTEEMVANAISTGNIATYDPLLSARPLDPRLEKMLQSLDGGDSPAKEAVKKRIIMAWNRLHGARAMAADQGTSGDA